MSHAETQQKPISEWEGVSELCVLGVQKHTHYFSYVVATLLYINHSITQSEGSKKGLYW